MDFQSYIETVASRPATTYMEKAIANWCNELRENPKNELWAKQQILMCAHLDEDENVVIDLALEMMAMDVEKIYAADCFFVLGRMYAKKKETTKAIEYYQKTIESDPEHDMAIGELAAIYEDLSDYDAAIAVYNHLDTEFFTDMKEYMYRNKGLCYYEKKEYEKALECFQAALAINSDDELEMITDNIGGCYFSLENYPEAFNWFRKSLEQNPQNATAHYGMGLCYEHTGDSYRALYHYWEAIKIRPDYTDAYNNFAAVTINQEGDYKAGIEMLKKAIDNCKDKKETTIVYNNLYRAYTLLREFTLANYYQNEYMKSLGFDSIVDDDDDE
jgi:tetratricopeptide (TPR) repeat protein